MRIKSDFIIHSMGDEHIAVPTNERTKEFRGVIRLNETGVFLWNRMEEEFTKEGLAAALCETYDVTKEQAESAVEAFVDKLAAAGMLEDVQL